jgi:tetratricopeptide (TPR) repeat protein
VYYKALAERKLGDVDAAKAALNQLLQAAEPSTEKAGAEQSPSGRKRARRSAPGLGHYLAGLAYLGLGDKESAAKEFTAALVASPELLGAKAALAGLQ